MAKKRATSSSVPHNAPLKSLPVLGVLLAREAFHFQQRLGLSNLYALFKSGITERPLNEAGKHSILF